MLNYIKKIKSWFKKPEPTADMLEKLNGQGMFLKECKEICDKDGERRFWPFEQDKGEFKFSIINHDIKETLASPPKTKHPRRKWDFDLYAIGEMRVYENYAGQTLKQLYKLAHDSAYNYGKKHNKKFKVTKEIDSVRIYRVRRTRG